MLIFNLDSTAEYYAALYLLPVGTVFKIEEHYESVMLRIEEYTPDTKHFEAFPITPGTQLFAMYGCDCCIITINEDLTS